MIVNIIESNGRKMVALCDEEILGRKIENKKICLDLTSSFYAGIKKSPKEIIELLDYFFTINAVGKKSVDFLLKELSLDRDSVKEVEGIPYIFVFRM